MSQNTIHHWRETTALPARRVGRVWRCTLSEVSEWVRSGANAAAEQKPPESPEKGEE